MQSMQNLYVLYSLQRGMKLPCLWVRVLSPFTYEELHLERAYDLTGDIVISLTYCFKHDKALKAKMFGVHMLKDRDRSQTLCVYV
jgi:hypothetical protein